MAFTNISSDERREALILLQDFRVLQEERTRQYNYLNNAHKVYLESGKSAAGKEYDLDTYKVSVKESTDKFNSISAKIMDIAKKIEVFCENNGERNASSKPPISFIRRIQVRNTLELASIKDALSPDLKMQ